MRSNRCLSIVLCASGLLLLISCGKRETQTSETSSNITGVVTPSTSAPSPQSSAPAAPQIQFQKLKGKWVRPDGGYVLEIKEVEDAGRMNAGYFNPNPINVGRAEAFREGATVKVFIELRDVNYPGSTYTLSYDPQNEQLKGIYYQAMEQQRYPVFFVRMPPE